MLDEFDFRYDLGIALRADSVTIEQKESVISAVAKHFAVLAIKAELDQLLCGLSSTLDVLELLRSDPTVMRPLLVSSSIPRLTADEMFDTFHIHYSPNGSNKKEKEEATIMLWFHYLQTVERKMIIISIK